MKILCVIDSLGSGGAQRQMVNLARGFKEKGHEVSFLTYHAADFYGKLLAQVAIPIKTITESNYLKRLFKMRNYIRSGNYDVVLSFLEGPSFICEMAAFPSRTWKLLVGERNADPNIFKSRKLMAYRWFHLVADYVVSNSHENIKMVKKINPLLSDNKCRVIYNMVDFERWKPTENFEYRNNDKFSLIVVANHQESKNAKGLVQALHLLPSKYKDQIKIDWFGRRDSFELEAAYAEAESLVKEFQLENVISFFDPSLSIHEIVPDYDALGLFSFHEGLSNSVCEGMASGKPIISTDVSDIKLIIKNGFNGFVVDSCQPESIKNALIKLLDCSNEDLAKMGKNAGITATELFNKETVVSAYIDLMLK